MIILPALIANAAKHLHHGLREIAYDDMARQASGWIPDEARTENNSRNNQAIAIDFAVPKKHRLAWISRTIEHLHH
jgi:hypothetical protein